MNQATIDRLKAAAPSIESFRHLHTEEQEWLEPLLHKTAKTALDILDAISNKPMTYEEIAAFCELHPTSVRQILYALSEGGCKVDLSEKSAFAPTGRPRNLARR